MTVVCEFCDRSFTYNNKTKQKCDQKVKKEKKLPTIKTTAPHWLRIGFTRGKRQASQRGCVCVWARAHLRVRGKEGERERAGAPSPARARCCTHATRQAHLIDRSVFVTSVNMLLYFDFKLSYCPFTSLFYWLKNSFHFFALIRIFLLCRSSYFALVLFSFLVDSFLLSLSLFKYTRSTLAALQHILWLLLLFFFSVDWTADSFSGLYILEWNC